MPYEWNFFPLIIHHRLQITVVINSNSSRGKFQNFKNHHKIKRLKKQNLLWLWEKSWQWQQLCRINVELVSLGIRSCYYPFHHLNREILKKVATRINKLQNTKHPVSNIDLDKWNQEKREIFSKAHWFIDGAEDLIHFPDLRLVLKINRSIKVRHFLIGELRHSISLTSMKKRRDLWKIDRLVWNPKKIRDFKDPSMETNLRLQPEGLHRESHRHHGHRSARLSRRQSARHHGPWTLRRL